MDKHMVGDSVSLTQFLVIYYPPMKLEGYSFGVVSASF